MSPIRRSLAAFALGTAAVAWLSGCSGSEQDRPTSAHGTHRRVPQPSGTRATVAPSPSGRTVSPASTTPSAGGALRFSPRSGGRHLDDCQLLVPGDDPAEFLYYPVEVLASQPVTVDSIRTAHTRGVVDAAAWVAPSVSTTATGTVKGWPPGRIVTHDKNLRWSQRVPAAGATLDPKDGSYNVFLRVQVDPTRGDSAVDGLVFGYHDAEGSHIQTWVAHTSFSMDC